MWATLSLPGRRLARLGSWLALVGIQSTWISDFGSRGSLRIQQEAVVTQPPPTTKSTHATGNPSSKPSHSARKLSHDSRRCAAITTHHVSCRPGLTDRLALDCLALLSQLFSSYHHTSPPPPPSFPSLLSQPLPSPPPQPLIVDKINSSIGQDQSAKNIIGVLDIYGFESFKINRSCSPDEKTACAAICDRMGLKGYQVINWNLMQKFYQMTNFKLQEPAAAPLAPDLSKQKYLADRQQSTRSSSSGMGISSGYSGMVGKSEDQSRIEAKYPAILFKQQLTAYVEKIYGMIRDSLKKEISPFLTLCIQVLSVPQIYRIGTMFWDDKYGTHGVSQDVRLDISLTDLEPPPPLLRENPELLFLLQQPRD
ncbi:hypothetical protein BHE74_00005617 [Ensete ventricosum]|nr:hypothetical protein BHE74_00005617 [Ensete ventricosum]RZS04951.1 hypothetical protein BHM03_00035369 [Ensete ventricosum]